MYNISKNIHPQNAKNKLIAYIKNHDLYQIFFKQTFFFNELQMFINHTLLKSKNIINIYKFITNKTINKLIVDNQNQVIQILNSKPRVLEIDEHANNSLCFYLWAHNSKHLISLKKYMWKLFSCLPTIAKDFQFHQITHLIVNIITTHSSRLTWWHHCWKQFTQIMYHYFHCLLAPLVFS